MPFVNGRADAEGLYDSGRLEGAPVAELGLLHAVGCPLPPKSVIERGARTMLASEEEIGPPRNGGFLTVNSLEVRR
jgi:hypothetical protein